MQKIFKIVSEAIGEYPELDRRMKSIWSNILDHFESNSNEQHLFTNTKEYPKETALIRAVIKGANVVVRAIPSHDRNAFVIPGIVPEEDITGWYESYKAWLKKHNVKWYNVWMYDETIPPMCFFFMKSVKRLQNMSKYKIEKHGDHNIIIFPKSSVPLNIWVTYGILTHMTPEERIAIYLHEIGHWVDAAKSIPEQMLKDDEESIYSAFTIMYQRLITRYEEFKADKFAYMAGYGKELKSAFDSLVNRRNNVHIFTKFADSAMKDAVDADNEYERLGLKYDPRQYPSIEKRKDWLDRYEKEKTKK